MPPGITKTLSLLLCFCLIFEQASFAQIAPGPVNLGANTTLLSKPLVTDKFRPLHLRYLSYDPKLEKFNLLLDKGDAFSHPHTFSLPFMEKISNLASLPLVALAMALAKGGQTMALWPIGSQTTARWLVGTTTSNLASLPLVGRAREGDNVTEEKIKSETKNLFKYFLIGLILPNDAFWVNLRPDTKDNIIDPDLAQTDMGKIFLEADLELKKAAARLTSPNTPQGRIYWDKLFTKAQELYGQEEIAVPTLVRPWIVPGEIVLRQAQGSAYIYKATLKVMLEQDYLQGAGDPATGGSAYGGRGEQRAIYQFQDKRQQILNEYAAELNRSLILPRLNQEVNLSKKYASLRQVYYSLILAQWFKSRSTPAPLPLVGTTTSNLVSLPLVGRAREGVMGANTPNPYSTLIDSRDLSGLTSKTPWSKDTYYKAYQKSVNKGEYKIQEPIYTSYGQSIKTYFSGGIVAKIIFPSVDKSGLNTTAGVSTAIIAGNPNNTLPHGSNIIPAAIDDAGVGVKIQEGALTLASDNTAEDSRAEGPAKTQQPRAIVLGGGLFPGAQWIVDKLGHIDLGRMAGSWMKKQLAAGKEIISSIRYGQIRAKLVLALEAAGVDKSYIGDILNNISSKPDAAAITREFVNLATFLEAARVSPYYVRNIFSNIISQPGAAAITREFVNLATFLEAARVNPYYVRNIFSNIISQPDAAAIAREFVNLATALEAAGADQYSIGDILNNISSKPGAAAITREFVNLATALKAVRVNPYYIERILNNISSKPDAVAIAGTLVNTGALQEFANLATALEAAGVYQYSIGDILDNISSKSDAVAIARNLLDMGAPEQSAGLSLEERFISVFVKYANHLPTASVAADIILASRSKAELGVSLPQELNEALKEISSGRMDINNPLHLLVNFLNLHINLGQSSGTRKELTYESYYDIIQQAQNRALAQELAGTVLPEEDMLNIRGLAYEAFLIREKILEAQERARQIGRKVVVVANLSYGGVALSPIVEERNGSGDYIVGTDIPVWSTKVGSTESHNNEFVLVDNLFTLEQIKILVEENPFVVMVDGSTSVSDSSRTSAHIPDGFKGYRNFFIVLNQALYGQVNPAEFYEDEEFVNGLLDTPSAKELIKMIQGMNIQPRAPNAYKFRFWYERKASSNKEEFLYLRVNKQKATPAPKVNIAELDSPTGIFIQSAIHPEDIDPSIQRDFIGGQHTPAYFDDRDHFKQFYLAYEEGYGVVPSKRYVYLARQSFLDFMRQQGRQLTVRASATNKVREVETVVLDLDGTLVATDASLTNDTAGKINNLLQAGKRVVIITEDIEMHMDNRLRNIIKGPNFFVFSDGGTMGYTFDSEGNKLYLTAYNAKNIIAPDMQERILGIISSNFAQGTWQMDDRESRVSVDYRIDLRSVSNRANFVAKLQGLLDNAGIQAKVYMVGRTSVKVVLQHKEHALKFFLETTQADEQKALILADSAHTHGVDRGLLTVLPRGISINVGSFSPTISRENPNIVQYDNGGPDATLKLLSNLALYGGIPENLIIPSSQGQSWNNDEEPAGQPLIQSGKVSRAAIGKGSSLSEAGKVALIKLDDKALALARSKIDEIRDKVNKAILIPDERNTANQVIERLEQYFARSDELGIASFQAIVKGQEDYLLAFATPFQIVLMNEFFTTLSDYLDEALFHEAYEALEVARLGALSRDQIHQEAYQGIQRKIFGQENPLKGVLRNYINTKVSNQEIRADQAGVVVVRLSGGLAINSKKELAVAGGTLGDVIKNLPDPVKNKILTPDGALSENILIFVNDSPEVISSDDLAKPLGATDRVMIIYKMAGGAGLATIEEAREVSGQRFQAWLNNVSPERLRTVIQLKSASGRIAVDINDTSPFERAKNAEIIKLLAEAGLSDLVKEAVRGGINLRRFIIGLSDSDWNMRVLNAQAIESLAKAGLLDKEAVGGRLLEQLILGLGEADLFVNVAYARAIKSLIAAGVLDKEMVINRIPLERLISALSDKNPYIRARNAEAIYYLIQAGVLDKDVVNKMVPLGTLVAGLSDGFSHAANAEAIKFLIQAGVLDRNVMREMVNFDMFIDGVRYTDASARANNLRVIKFLSEVGLSEVNAGLLELLILGLNDTDSNVRAISADTVKSLAEAGLLNLTVVNGRLLENLIAGLSSADSFVYLANINAIKSLIEAGVLDKDEVKKKIYTERFILGLSEANFSLVARNSEAIKYLVEAGLLDKEEVRNRVPFERFISELSSASSYKRAEVAEAINFLVEAGVLDREKFSLADLPELEAPLTDEFSYYYLRLLDQFKDDSGSARKIFDYFNTDLLALANYCVGSQDEDFFYQRLAQLIKDQRLSFEEVKYRVAVELLGRSGLYYNDSIRSWDALQKWIESLKSFPLLTDRILARIIVTMRLLQQGVGQNPGFRNLVNVERRLPLVRQALAGALERLSPLARKRLVKAMPLGTPDQITRLRDQAVNLAVAVVGADTRVGLVGIIRDRIHNRPSPQDLSVVEAYLKFIESDGIDAFDLSRFGYVGEVIKDAQALLVTFDKDKKEEVTQAAKALLETLNDIYGGGSINTINEAFQRWQKEIAGQDELKKKISILLGSISRDGFNYLEDILEARQSLFTLQNELSGEALLLTIALDNRLEVLYYAKSNKLMAVIDRKNQQGELTLQERAEMVISLLKNTQLNGYAREEIEIILLELAQFNDKRSFTHEDYLRLYAIYRRIERIINTASKVAIDDFQEMANRFGRNVDQAGRTWVENFSSNIFRSDTIYLLSLELNKAKEELMQEAGISGWQVVVPGSARGRLRFIKDMTELVSVKSDEIIVIEKLPSDSPPITNVAGIITLKEDGLLSHPAIRARQHNIPFAVCLDKSLDEFKNGDSVSLEINGEDVVLSHAEDSSAQTRDSPSSVRISSVVMITPDLEGGSFIIQPADYQPGLVGNKAYNLGRIPSGLLPEQIFPKHLSLSFSLMQRVLDEDPDIKAELDKLKDKLSRGEDVSKTLERMRFLIESLVIPEGYLNEILSKAIELFGRDASLFLRSSTNAEDLSGYAAAGLYDSYGNVKVTQEELSLYIKKVWASVWNERAFLDRQAHKINHNNVHMAVLIQEAIPADYAFVIHTYNPANSNKDELVIEVVQGLGESLVSGEGEYSGSPYRFIYNRETKVLTLVGFANKSRKLAIEDGQMKSVLASYLGDSLTTEEGKKFLAAIAQAAIEIERSFEGKPQDIEGAITLKDKKWQVAFLQSRDQVENGDSSHNPAQIGNPADATGANGTQSGHMKPLGKRDSMDEDAELDLLSRHPEFETLANSVQAADVYGVQARVISSDLGNAGAYHFKSPALGLIIVVNSRYDSQIQEEGKYHEAREAYWMSKGFNQHEAHVIASAEQVQKFSQNNSPTPYHLTQIQNMSSEQLQALVDEDENARKWHHDVLEKANKAGANIDIEKIKEYEKTLYFYPLNIIDQLIDKVSNMVNEKEAFYAKWQSMSVGSRKAEITNMLRHYSIEVAINFLTVLETYLSDKIPDAALFKDFNQGLLIYLPKLTGKFHLWTKQAIEEFAIHLDSRVSEIREGTGREPVVVEVAAGDGDLSYGLQTIRPSLRIIPTDAFYSPLLKEGDHLHDAKTIQARGVKKLRTDDIESGAFRQQLGISEDTPVIIIASHLPNGEGAEKPLFNQAQVNELILVVVYMPQSHEKVAGERDIVANNKVWTITSKPLNPQVWFSGIYAPSEGILELRLETFSRRTGYSLSEPGAISQPVPSARMGYRNLSPIIERMKRAKGGRVTKFGELISGSRKPVSYEFPLRRPAKENLLSWQQLFEAPTILADDFLNLLTAYLGLELPTLDMLIAIYAKTIFTLDESREFHEILDRYTYVEGSPKQESPGFSTENSDGFNLSDGARMPPPVSGGAEVGEAAEGIIRALKNVKSESMDKIIKAARVVLSKKDLNPDQRTLLEAAVQAAEAAGSGGVDGSAASLGFARDDPKELSDSEGRSPSMLGGEAGGIDGSALLTIDSPEETGGIDSSTSSPSTPKKKDIGGVDFTQIQMMLNVGNIPSTQTIKDSLLISCQAGTLNSHAETILGSLAGILRLEEEYPESRQPELLDILSLIDSEKSPADLQQELNNLACSKEEFKLEL